MIADLTRPVCTKCHGFLVLDSGFDMYTGKYCAYVHCVNCGAAYSPMMAFNRVFRPEPIEPRRAAGGKLSSFN